MKRKWAGLACPFAFRVSVLQFVSVIFVMLRGASVL